MCSDIFHLGRYNWSTCTKFAEKFNVYNNSTTSWHMQVATNLVEKYQVSWQISAYLINEFYFFNVSKGIRWLSRVRIVIEYLLNRFFKTLLKKIAFNIIVFYLRIMNIYKRLIKSSFSEGFGMLGLTSVSLIYDPDELIQRIYVRKPKVLILEHTFLWENQFCYKSLVYAKFSPQPCDHF